jgi:A/G-specific adenine glycosylase
MNKRFYPLKQLVDWFKQTKRSFPWREERTPYRVWIAEVMLQQTRASVVIPYFLRWMERFPDIQALSAASIEEIIKTWEGLGYYSRARNLHKGAKQIVEKFNGVIPDSHDNLASIYGIGPYTVGAILSFGFHQRAVALDGNVTRVVSRYFAIDENVCRSSVRKRIVSQAEGLLDEKEPWVSAEALIELGATLCTPKPRCGECPLQKGCLGLEKGIAESLPIKNKEKEIVVLNRLVAVIEAEGQFLVCKRKTGEVMADLYEFPYFERGFRNERGESHLFEGGIFQNLDKLVEKRFGFHVEWIGALQKVIHTFTRYKAHLIPFLMRAPHLVELPGWNWIHKENLSTLPFSSGHKKILMQL